MHLREKGGSVQQRVCEQAGDLTILQTVLLPDGLDASDIKMVWLMGAALLPSILCLLLALFALWLPDDRSNTTVANTNT